MSNVYVLWVKEYQICQWFGRPVTHANLCLIQADHLLQLVGLDVHGPFPVDGDGHRYILSIVNMHSRCLEMGLMTSTDIQQVIDTIPKF